MASEAQSNLNELLSAFWDSAHANENTDRTKEMAIMAVKYEIADMIEMAHMAGQSDAGVDPSYSNAQAYRRKRLGG